ncbi:hypothetical protein FISHEDRAFT_59307 [Fistulina hepatica ATCC 64428]|uniref:Uncharacterized protein n=1 Tax=Fistulina hepatica ATCC 64428 TaxID=1128425 RepID=A0A0D7AB32_9AGAR|nr:hypothetical protein FISHEDRAFT_59307 [Fistulina hepatica ATCC 64428]
MSSPFSPPPVEPPSYEELEHNADLLIREYLPQPREKSAGVECAALSLPFCIPQIKSSAIAPFARGTNATLLDALGLSDIEWLRFLDGLNLAIVARVSSASRAWLLVSCTPYHWAIIAGTAMQVASQTAIAVLSKTLTDRYLRAANQNVFHPRGLSVRLITTPALLHILHGTEPKTSSKKETLKKVGRGVGGILLNLPVVGSIAGPFGTTLQRRLDVVQGYALPVDLDVPRPQKPIKAMDHIQKWGVKMEQGLQRWQESRANKWRAIAERERAEREANPNGFAARRARRDQMRLLGPKGTKAEQRAANADLLEHWGNKTVVWVVVMTAENEDNPDEQIEGIEKADSWDNEETVSLSVFEAEVRTEEKDQKEFL